jgi:hypothetical protein
VLSSTSIHGRCANGNERCGRELECDMLNDARRKRECKLRVCLEAVFYVCLPLPVSPGDL